VKIAEQPSINALREQEKVRFVSLKFKKLVSLILFYMYPKAAYKKWELRTESEAVSGYLVNLESDSNLFLYNLLTRVEFQTLCEVGSNVGNRIINLAKINPSKDFMGTDINEAAIKVGRKYLAANGFANIRLGVEDLTKPANDIERFDIVLSWATLVIFPPRMIENALRNIARRADKYVILIERVVESNESFFHKRIALLKGFPNYAYDYQEKFAKYGFALIHEETVPRDVWAPGGGRAKALILKRMVQG
jgi:hypothetical protein